MRIKELENLIPEEIRKAKRRTAAAIENAANHKAVEVARNKTNNLYMAMFFWEKYHLRKRTHDFYTEQSQIDALKTILEYLWRI